MTEVKYYTREGYEKLKAELHEIKTKGRTDIAKQISEAREKGDLSENAEYDAAKEAQGLLEMRISLLELEISNARILEDQQVDTSKAYILSTVRVKNLKNNQEQLFTLVSPKEANLKEHKISVDSPIGKGLLGKQVGDKVVINVPAGKLEFEILEISR
jgi:transcription elongation factor GreA